MLCRLWFGSPFAALVGRSQCRRAVSTLKPSLYSAAAEVPSFRQAVEFPAPQPGGYGEISYWDKRYSEQPDTTLDWFQGYSYFQPIVSKHIPRSARILMAGCGNSAMSEEMVNDGYENIVNTDLSAVVIANLRAKYTDVPQLSYMTMDARDMSVFEDASFDAAIDKGLADAMLCGPNPAEGVIQMLKETHRVLRPGGTFMLITYGHPMIRMPAILEPGLTWSVLMYILAKPGSPEDLQRTVEGTEPEAVVMNNSNWQLGQHDENAGKNLTFVYVCTKAKDVSSSQI